MMFLPDHFKINPFEKHIFKIEQIIELIKCHETVGGLNMHYSFTETDILSIKTATSLLSDAVKELKKMDKRKNLYK